MSTKKIVLKHKKIAESIEPATTLVINTPSFTTDIPHNVESEYTMEIPSDVISELKRCATEAKQAAEECSDAGDVGTANNHYTLADVATQLLDFLEAKSDVETKRAVVFYTSIQSPIQLMLPDIVRAFLATGATPKKSLLDYFRATKK